MAVVDDFGRVTKLTEDLKSLADSLKASVGKAVEFMAEKSKGSTDKMKEEFDKLVEAMEELGDDVKESLKSTKGFVEEVKRAADSIEKMKSQRSDVGRDTLAAAQKEQTRILQQILASQQKAVSDKVAKFTSGSVALATPRAPKQDLKSMGFRPRGADKIPAMVSPNEFIVSKKGTMGNEGLLDKINRGYMRGGKVKPAYFAEGSSGTWRGRKYTVEEIEGRMKMVIEGYLDKDELAELKTEFGHLGEDLSVEFADKFDRKFKESASKWFVSIATAFTGGGDPWQVMFEGAVKDVTEFRREMRNLAFQSEGITGNFREAQAEFSKIGQEIAGRTGVNVTAFQKAYMNNARKGFKDQKAGMKVLESGLELSTMIGSETQATANLFGDWHRELGLSAIQMEKMSRDMRSVALNTGVTGDELLGAMKASDGILKNLRNQGTLTSNVAKSVVTMMAEAQKTGYTESTNKVLTALSSHSGMMSADSSTQALLYTVANKMGGDATGQMLTGNFMRSRENLAGFSTNMKDMVAGLIGKQGADLDFSKLTDQERDLLAMRLRAYGIEIGEAESLIKTTEKASKGLRGTMDELDKVATSEFATDEQKRLAEKQRNDALLAASMDFLSGVRDKTGDQSLAEAMKGLEGSKDFANQRQDFSAMASALTPSMMRQFGLSGSQDQVSQQMAAMDVQKQAQLSSMIAADQLMKAAKSQGKTVKDFGPEMQSALAKGDTKRFNELRDEMQGEFSKIGVDAATNVDPMEALEQTMSELNETIRNSFSPLTGGIIDLIGWMGLLAIQVGLMGGSLHNLIGANFMQWLAPGNLRTTIMGAFQKGAGFMNGPMGMALRTALGPAMLLLGGIKGVMEADSAKRTKTEGFILGALTGGAKTGSFLSSTLGIEKGSAGDKALGVAGAAAWGAAVGTAFAPGIGTLVGALVGGGMEIIKIITEGTDILQDIFAPLQVIVNFIYNTFKNIWDVVAGIFTLDIGRVFKGLFSLIGDVVMLFPRLIMASIQQIVIGIPKLILRVVSFIWEIPKAIMGAIKSALESLVDNPWVGPIFKVLSDAFNMIYDGFMAIWTPISEIFSGLYRVVSDIGKAIFGAGEGGGVLAGVMWALQTAVYAVAYAVSWLLVPIKILAWALGFVLKVVGKLIAGIIYPFQYLYDVLVGHSIVPDLVTGIISWFATLPVKIFKFLVGIPIKILKRMPKALVGVFKAVFLDFPKWLLGKISDGFWAVGNFLFLTLPKMMWSGFKNALNSMGKWLWDTIAWPFKKLGELLKAVFVDFPIWLGNTLMSGLQAVFYDLPMWLGSTIASGLQAVFYDLPVWLGKTIWDGMASIASGIPGAIYGALHTAASAIGLGWLVDKLAGGKKPTPSGDSAEKGSDYERDLRAMRLRAYGIDEKGAQGLLKGFSEADASNLALGATTVVAGGLALKKVAPKVVGLAGDAFDKVGKVVPKDIGKHASTAFKSIKGGAERALGKVGKLMPKSVSKIAEKTGAFFSPMKKAFSRSMAQGEGVFKAMSRGIKSQLASTLRGKSLSKFASDAFGGFKRVASTRVSKLASDAFGTLKKLVPTRIAKSASGAFGSVKSMFSPFTKGFSRSMTKGDGVFKAFSRGAKSQVASMPRMRAMTKFAHDAFKNVKSKGVLPKGVQKLATESFKSFKSFFSPLTKGFSRSMAKGDGVFKAVSRGVKGQMSSMFRGSAIGRTASGLLGRVRGLPGNIGRMASGFMGGKGEMLTKGLGAAKDLGGKAVGAIGKVGGKAAGALGKVGGMASGAVGKAGGLFSSVAGKGVGALAKKIPVVGALLDFGIRKASGQSTGKAATGAAGGLAGAAAGAAIGTAIFPVVGTAIGAIVGGLGGGWVADKLYDNVGPVFETVGKGISDAATFAWDGMKKMGSTIWEGAKGLGSKLWEGTKGLASKMSDGAKWLKDNVGPAMLGPIGLVADGIKNIGSWLFGWGDKDKENKENAAANMAMARIEAQTVVLSTAVGQHAIPTARPNEAAAPNTNVEPVHLRDITGTILRDRAGSGGNKLQSDELSRMEEASYRQVEELEQIRQGIQELVSLMKPRGGGVAGSSDEMGPARTKDPRRPMHAAKFGKMKYGKMGGSPNRSFVNNGEV